MESYILKLYRRGNGDKDKLAGFLEDVADGKQTAFRSFEELRTLLLEESSGKILKYKRDN